MRNGRLPARNVVKPVRGVAGAQLAAVSSALGLSAEESRALKLISEWEGLSPVELCNLGFAGYMESSFGDLQGFAFGQTGGRPKEQTWALKFYPAVKEFFTENGNLKEFEPTPAVADGESPDDAKGGLDPIKSKTPVTLVFTGPDGREVARVAMSGQLFTGLKVAARKLGVSISKFVERSVREDLKRRAALVKGGARCSEWPR